MRDMVPRNQRSIRDIPVPSHPRKREAIPRETMTHTVEEDYMQRPLRPRTPRRRGRRWFVLSAILVVVVCAIGGLLLSTLFAGATVTVYPRNEQVSAPKTLIAKLNPSTGDLGYQLMTVSRSASTTVPATGTHQVSRSASGIVTIYNSYSAEPQRLIANTRFAATDGKIYRIRDSVTVPGTVKGADGSVTPGATTATIYADSPGESYNKNGETKYTIPGFKGDPRYDKFYAQGNSMSGGFVGVEPAVAQADLNQASDLIKQGLSQAAQSSLASQVPPGYLPVPGSLQIVFTPLTQSPGAGNTVTIAQTATMSGAIVRESDLASAVAGETIEDYQSEPVAFADISELSLATATSSNTGDVITLSLSGTPILTWQYDADALKAALVGKSKSTFESIIESFAPAIARAEAKIRPFWQGSFPTDPNKIKVQIGQ